MKQIKEEGNAQGLPAGAMVIEQITINEKLTFNDIIDQAAASPNPLFIICLASLNDEDLVRLASINNIVALNLFACENITDLTPFAGHPNLQSLTLADCPHLDNIAPLKDIPHLHTLELFLCPQLNSSCIPDLMQCHQLTTFGANQTNIHAHAINLLLEFIAHRNAQQSQ